MASARKLPASYNVSTYGDGTRDYSSLATWEAATDNNLVTAAAGEVLECYDDAASFNDGVTLSGATTNSSYFRVIRPATGHGHTGTPNAGVFFDKTSGGYVVSIQEGYSQAHDLIARLTINTAASWYTFRVTEANAALIGCISWDISDSGSGSPSHFGVQNTSGAGFAVDCLAIGGTGTNGGFRVGATGGTGYAYNCTAYNPGGTCFIRTGGTATARNCLAGSATGFSGTWTNSNNNASTDGTAPGTSSRTSQTFTFVNAAGDDVHLSSSDAGAKGFGADLSADGNYAFNDDIDGQTVASWSIGMDTLLGALLTGTLSISASHAGALSIGKTLSGGLALALAHSGTFTPGKLFAGDLTCSLNQTGGIETQIQLAGTVVASLEGSGDLTAGVLLQGDLPETLSITGDFQRGVVFSGVLSTAMEVAGAVQTGQTLAGTLSMLLSDQGTLQTGQTLSGALSSTLDMTSDLQAASGLAGALSLALLQSGALAGGVLLDGSLLVDVGQAGAVVSGVTLQGDGVYAMTQSGILRVGVLLDGACTHSLNATGALTVVAGIVYGRRLIFLQEQLAQPTLAHTLTGPAVTNQAVLVPAVLEEQLLT